MCSSDLSDLVYIPDGDTATAKRVVDVLLTQDYVSGIFVDSKLGKFPGTLSLDDIALEGAAITPRPARVQRPGQACWPRRCRTVLVTSRVLVSGPAPNGLATVVNMQMVGETRYFDAAGFAGRTVGLSSTVLPAATQ